MNDMEAAVAKLSKSCLQDNGSRATRIKPISHKGKRKCPSSKQVTNDELPRWCQRPALYAKRLKTSADLTQPVHHVTTLMPSVATNIQLYAANAEKRVSNPPIHLEDEIHISFPS